jgi:hypothetical protein
MLPGSIFPGMSDAYRIARNNRYWHVVGEGGCGSVASDEVGSYLNREGPWEDLAAALEADPAPRCDDCTFPDE